MRETKVFTKKAGVPANEETQKIKTEKPSSDRLTPEARREKLKREENSSPHR